MKLYLFEYLAHKDGYKYVWIPAHSPKCAAHKASTKNVVKDDAGVPVLIREDSKTLSSDWR